MDYPRTVAEHLEDTPNFAGLGETKEARVEALRTSFAKQDFPGSKITLSFTEDTMTTVDMNGEQVFSYTEVGGNSGMVILQVTNTAGIEWLMNVRFIDTGLAIEPTDCDTYPKQCEEEQRHNRERTKAARLAAGKEVITLDSDTDQQLLPSLAYFVPKE